jgi:serine/threonine protein kinase
VLFDKRQQISDEQKMQWILGIALGMCHLHKHNIVHRDLASKNILLTQASGNGTPKISVTFSFYFLFVTFFICCKRIFI